MLALAVERDWRASGKSSPKVDFKVGIIHDDDPDLQLMSAQAPYVLQAKASEQFPKAQVVFLMT